MLEKLKRFFGNGSSEAEDGRTPVEELAAVRAFAGRAVKFLQGLYPERKIQLKLPTASEDGEVTVEFALGNDQTREWTVLFPVDFRGAKGKMNSVANVLKIFAAYQERIAEVGGVLAPTIGGSWDPAVVLQGTTFSLRNSLRLARFFRAIDEGAAAAERFRPQEREWEGPTLAPWGYNDKILFRR